MNKTGMILEHLQQGKPITPLEALEKFRSFRLGSIIYNLRKCGYNIKTDIVDHGDAKFAKYYLEAL